jgi:RNase P/RNase MRP subunit p29
VNVIGQTVTVLSSKDPTNTGRTGRVLLDTANTLVLDSEGRNIRIEKAGAAFMILGTNSVITGSDIAGRLQDRLGRRKA